MRLFESPTRAQLDEIANGLEAEMLIPDGFEGCCLGYVEVLNDGPRFVFDAEAIILQIQQETGGDELDAVEYFEFNVAGAHFSHGEPLYLWRIDET